MTQYVVVDFVDIVNEEIDEEKISDGSPMLVAVSMKLMRCFHRDCNYKVTDSGTLVVYPVDGRAVRDERVGPVGGYADGVWRRYWYEYRDEPAVDPRDGRI